MTTERVCRRDYPLCFPEAKSCRYMERLDKLGLFSLEPRRDDLIEVIKL